jgi:N12 class adenine-specific DNA methylase
MISLQKLRFLLVVSMTILLNNSSVMMTFANEDNESKNSNQNTLKKWASQAREQYDQLPEQGKFATGAIAGFGASKLVVNSAVKFVKIAGAAFIA